MSTEANKMLAQRFFTEIVGEQHLDQAADLFAADYRHHDPGLPPEMQGSRDAYISHLPMYEAAFPDMQIAVDQMIAEDDRVATHWTLTGTHNGPLMNIPPTGKHVHVSGITIQRIESGMIVEGWTNFDTFGLLQQIGVAPMPG